MWMMYQQKLKSVCVGFIGMCVFEFLHLLTLFRFSILCSWGHGSVHPSLPGDIPSFLVRLDRRSPARMCRSIVTVEVPNPILSSEWVLYPCAPESSACGKLGCATVKKFGFRRDNSLSPFAQLPSGAFLFGKGFPLKSINQSKMLCFRVATGHLSWSAVLLKSLRHPPTPVGRKGFQDLFCFSHGSDAGDAGDARDATTQRTGTDPIFASNFSRLSDTQIDQTQKIPEMSAMNAGNAAGWPQKSAKNQGFLIFLKINHQKQILANTPKMDFQKHDNAGDVSQ